ncbi:hypothetical protein Y032_0487g2351 [Ancylostoma ceylanicum]|uniref:MSP domain-containing protein n=2 Tax=Ancylostoma ceylanicum TaxID=53326 RepID=A0A016WXA2_9BILA|nr:hypothetical protein Y032_0487g2351 [Ancylostoma ceylanicum]
MQRGIAQSNNLGPPARAPASTPPPLLNGAPPRSPNRALGGGGPTKAVTPIIIETYQDLLRNRIVGETPDGEILCVPRLVHTLFGRGLPTLDIPRGLEFSRWLVFNSPTTYKKPCYGDFTITNKDPFTVAWCIKAKEKMMRLSQSHGILKPGEHLDLTLYLISSDDWPRDVVEYTGRRLKLVVENLKIPDNIRPKNKLVSATVVSREERELVPANLILEDFRNPPACPGISFITRPVKVPFFECTRRSV